MHHAGGDATCKRVCCMHARRLDRHRSAGCMMKWVKRSATIPCFQHTKYAIGMEMERTPAPSPNPAIELACEGM
eukprot:scaffold180780_cov17-Tisochrysis_lutea.AAC.3